MIRMSELYVIDETVLPPLRAAKAPRYPNSNVFEKDPEDLRRSITRDVMRAMPAAVELALRRTDERGNLLNVDQDDNQDIQSIADVIVSNWDTKPGLRAVLGFQLERWLQYIFFSDDYKLDVALAKKFMSMNPRQRDEFFTKMDMNRRHLPAEDRAAVKHRKKPVRGSVATTEPLIGASHDNPYHERNESTLPRLVDVFRKA